jgi:hypothetical protein
MSDPAERSLSPAAIAFTNEAVLQARDALAYTRAALPYGPANQPDVWVEQSRRLALFTFGWRAYKFWQVRREQETELPPLDGITKAHVVAAAALKLQTGNCGEYSAVAFVRLLDRPLRPLEWLRCIGKDHQFVLIGRDRGQPVEDWRSWGPTTAVCDPWGDDAYAMRDAGDFRRKAACAASYAIDAAAL